MRYFNSPIDQTDLVSSFDLGRESTMDAEDLSLYNGTNVQISEDASAVAPRVSIAVLFLAFVVEAVY